MNFGGDIIQFITEGKKDLVRKKTHIVTVGISEECSYA